ncbi:hypothetical protein [uncultured Microbulbifer sp.]|uniref:hypothetical protein n=1 Tax=uncultured Microbulbifer sp. TaxID=348147 RepID=UPI002607D0C4|nr:hypothetical protein [uncultured Microbulbifer sp.]
MGTLDDRGHITVAVVEEEIGRLRYKWQSAPGTELNPRAPIEPLLGPGSTEQLDYDEPLKLANLIEVCRSCNPMAEAGRKLFIISRERKKSSNESHRVKQLLEKHGVRFEKIKAAL